MFAGYLGFARFIWRMGADWPGAVLNWRIGGIAALQRGKTAMPYPRLAPPLVGLALLLGLGPAAAQAPAAPPTPPPVFAPDAPLPLKPGDAFGQEVTLPQRTIVYLQGHASWDNAFDALVEAHKSLGQYLDKQGIKPTGIAMTIYTETDDNGFKFRAALPVAAAPATPPTGGIAVGDAPTGKALKFVHRGSYDAMDSTYEAITNYLDEKGLDAKDMFIEEYVTDILKTTPDNLVVNVFVPVK
jgi:effector-binding domain-containing protein